MHRVLTMELVRATEAAAIAAAQVRGHGDKNLVDQRAVDAMHAVFDEIDIHGIVVIGEGELDEAPKLYVGEKLGCGQTRWVAKQDANGQPQLDERGCPILREEHAPQIDIAVDPVDGTTLCAKGRDGAISALAISDKGGLFGAPDMYMEKLAVGPRALGTIDLEKSLTDNIIRVSQALGKKPPEVSIAILDRPRNQHLIDEARDIGCPVHLLDAGDIIPAIATAFPDRGIDMMAGSGGAPEGVLAAAALKCLKGDMCARLSPTVTNQEMNQDTNWQVSTEQQTINDLVPGSDVIIAMNAISNTTMLQGVHFESAGSVNTYSLVLRSRTGTRRFIEAARNIHTRDRWSRMSQ
jgi:fructose-1,6-bisphosphatase II